MNLGMSRLTVYLGVVAFIVVIGVVYQQFSGPQEKATAVIKAVGPTIGGPFQLVDHTGRTVTEKNYRGKFMLIFFGYTYCPDVCPSSLTTVTDALELLGAGAKNVVPLFITVDPTRDTPEQMKMYVKHFHPRLVGLSGTPKQVEAAAKGFRVYYKKAADTSAGADDYLVDHTSITYLMGPDGEFRLHFGRETSAKKMAESIRKLL